MKILTVFTGGTIGSKIENNIIDVKTKNEFALLDLFLNNYKDYNNINFECVEPVNFLSENITYNQINKIVSYLKSIDFNNYDGIIITHGSDTLSYSSAILGLVFSTVKIPIVIVASNYPPQCKESNALTNIKNAIDFIKNTDINGVFVSYSNDNNAIYLATRISEAEPYKDEFSPFSKSYFGTMNNGEFIYNKCYDNPSLEDVKLNVGYNLKENLNFKNKVMLIKTYPYIDYNAFNIENSKAILLYLYHSGTACVVGDSSNSVIAFIDRCKRLNIPVYGASLKNCENQYATTSKMIKSGMIPLQNISIESAYSKLCIAYNQIEIPPIDYMKKNIFFEIVQ